MVQNQVTSDEMGEESDEMDDITFCMSDCQQTDCFRHPSNIQDRTIPHSYADFKGTETCPEFAKDITVPINDTISRKAVIDEIDEWIKAFRENGHNESAADARLTKDGIIQLPSVQPQISGSAVNLCETCKYDFPECPKDSNVIFGDGKGSDNVCACSSYEVYVPPISKREWYQKGYEAGVKSVQPQRMRGKWIDGYLNEYHTARIATCSCCGYDGVPAVKEYNFCPNCGAWMEGQDETRGISETS